MVHPAFIFCLVCLVQRSHPSPAAEKVFEDEARRALGHLGQVMTLVNDRILALETNIGKRLDRLEKTSDEQRKILGSVTSRLDMLDSLVHKVDQLEERIRFETTSLKDTLSITNRDVQSLATQIEHKDVEEVLESVAGQGLLGSETVSAEKTYHDVRSRTSQKRTSLSDFEERFFHNTERQVARILASELNHFYLSMASKLDHSLGQVRKDLLPRMRNVEGLGLRTLTEVQETRQDVAHLKHLQTKGFESLKVQVRTERHNNTAECGSHLSAGQVEKIIISLNETIASNLEDLQQRRPPLANPPASSSSLMKRPSPQEAWIELAHSTTKYCPDPATFAALQEVKSLLQSVLEKNEELRRVMTKQASEGIDNLKLLNQRFSVLLRRINMDPDHGKVLVAEVKELLSLVQNSYASILHAQNAFIASCNMLHQKEPAIEEKLGDILKKLVVNIDLGHKFNRKHLTQLKELMEQTSINAQNRMDFIALPPSVKKHFSFWRGSVASAFNTTSSTANATLSRLQDILTRIQVTEVSLISSEWDNPEQKNAADELLTAAKDLIGYSKNEIRSMEEFQNSFEEFINYLSVLEDKFISDLDNSTLSVVNSTKSSVHSADHELTLPKECTLALLNQISSIEQKDQHQKFFMKNVKTTKKLFSKKPPLLLKALSLPSDRDDSANGPDEGGPEDNTDSSPYWMTLPDYLAANISSQHYSLPANKENSSGEQEETDYEAEDHTKENRDYAYDRSQEY